jgi:hydrogenase maturation protein HypF
VSSSHTRRKSVQNGVEILVQGIVQGVGFRPFVFKLASRYDISGTVTNTSEGVVIQARGPDDSLFAFIDAIDLEAPPLAQIITLDYAPLDSVLKAESFTIIPSRAVDTSQAIIPPDISLCEDCKKEISSRSDRRFRYPFTNCTNCGPRFSIVETIPYDRPKTSMKHFQMCALCLTEYEDPADRRFHAQPNACSACGPRISWHDGTGKVVAVEDILAAAIAALLDDKIIALKGLGGFHLSVNGLSEPGVETLRNRKNRPDKPLAIMVRDIASARRFCHVSEQEADTLRSPAHPIVLLLPRGDSGLARNLAPDMGDIGVMLPYTPLHHLLFEEVGCPAALVMTSGNSSGEPICTSTEDGFSKLSEIADHFLLHDRDIVTRVDDSVVKTMAGSPRLLRRSRGYVPSPLLVPYDLPEVIGCGGGLKSTFSLSRGKMIFPSQHIGDLFNLSSYDFYLESIANLKRLLEIEPIAVCCDMHPDYLSSHYAGELDLPRYEIQHHHAHAVSVMAEHGLTGPVLGIILDGTGYGPDNTIWGGEILLAEHTRFTRLASLEPLALPGGDAAAEEPWRMGLSLLHRVSGGGPTQAKLLERVAPGHRSVVLQMLESNFNTPLTSSCGRLFDGIAALLGLSVVSTFEGQAAMQLEACARQALPSNWKDSLIAALDYQNAYLHREKAQRWEIISSEFVKDVVYDISAGNNQPAIALQFHSWLISCISRLVEKLSGTTGITDIVLSGGCMQNEILLDGLIFLLSELGLTVYTGAQVPVNDGGISIGQTVIGGMQHVSRSTDES